MSNETPETEAEVASHELFCAMTDAATVCQNYREILRDERDSLPDSYKPQVSILRHLAAKELDRMTNLIATLEQNGNDQTL